MSFDTEIAIAAARLFSEMGESATYITLDGVEHAVTVFVHRVAQREPSGIEAQAATRQIFIDLLVAEIDDVRSIRRGESVRTATDCYLVERVEADDGIVVRVLCYLSEYARARG